MGKRRGRDGARDREVVGGGKEQFIEFSYGDKGTCFWVM